MQETAYAKLNLALHVRERGPDGYHRIETLFAFAEDGDRLRVAAADDLTLKLAGPFADDLGDTKDNLVLRAAEALRRRCGVDRGAALTLNKRLPIASGLGGGSADAAATLRLLTRWWKLEVEEAVLLEIAASLGADVPACLRSETARGEGRGDRLLPEDGSEIAGMPLLLVNPAVPLTTAAVFKGWSGFDRGELPVAPTLATALHGRNDLQAAAISLVPEIQDVLDSLAQQPEALLARMSGSGATCFVLFESFDARNDAAAAVHSQYPRWWQLASRLR